VSPGVIYRDGMPNVPSHRIPLSVLALCVALAAGGSSTSAAVPVPSAAATPSTPATDAPMRAGGTPFATETVPTAAPVTRGGPEPVLRDGFSVNCIACDPDAVVVAGDLAGFAPAEPSQTEIGAPAIAGRDATLRAEAHGSSESGPLLGFSAEVRFRPVLFHWDFGDGTGVSAVADDAGSTRPGSPDVTAVVTRRVFAARGPVDVALTVDFTAEYRFAGTAWRPVEGTVSVTATPLLVGVGDAHTGLGAPWPFGPP
jgi:hypothetical protein